MEGEAPDDRAMEARIARLEAGVAAIKIDIAVIKATGATKSDVADAKTTIILWVVSAIVLAQLVPSLVRLLE